MWSKISVKNPPPLPPGPPAEVTPHRKCGAEFTVNGPLNLFTPREAFGLLMSRVFDSPARDPAETPDEWLIIDPHGFTQRPHAGRGTWLSPKAWHRAREPRGALAGARRLSVTAARRGAGFDEERWLLWDQPSHPRSEDSTTSPPWSLTKFA